jgi:mannose-1-phosphate guanylyltransferase
VVLAAGDGTRLLPITRALYGVDLPKQFAVLSGNQSLLQSTIARARPLVADRNTVVVASEAYAPLARAQLSGWPGIETVAQPANLGTGPGVLLPLARVLARDPDANVLVFPADHHFARPQRLRTALQNALAAAALAPSGVALIGVPAERPAPDLGWIVRGGRLGAPALGARLVSGFAEKPDEETALRLLADGALWNTFIVAGRAQALWDLAARHLRRQAAAMAPLTWAAREGWSPRGLTKLYARMRPGDFCRDVLQRASGLAVITLVDSGWSDWGTPERVLEAIELGRRGARRSERTPLEEAPLAREVLALGGGNA